MVIQIAHYFFRACASVQESKFLPYSLQNIRVYKSFYISILIMATSTIIPTVKCLPATKRTRNESFV